MLTNNHVIDGATSIAVTVVSTGASYTATVVGTDPSADIAVLHLDSASGLATVTFSTFAAGTGQPVTAVGNAGGTGTLTAASGTVTALDQSITATDSGGGNAEQLSGLIQTNAGVQPGDSGGPLYDGAGAIVGMDTAASRGGAVQASPSRSRLPRGSPPRSSRGSRRRPSSRATRRSSGCPSATARAASPCWGWCPAGPPRRRA